MYLLALDFLCSLSMEIASNPFRLGEIECDDSAEKIKRENTFSNLFRYKRGRFTDGDVMRTRSVLSDIFLLFFVPMFAHLRWCRKAGQR